MNLVHSHRARGTEGEMAKIFSGEISECKVNITTELEEQTVCVRVYVCACVITPSQAFSYEQTGYI